MKATMTRRNRTFDLMMQVCENDEKVLLTFLHENPIEGFSGIKNRNLNCLLTILAKFGQGDIAEMNYKKLLKKQIATENEESDCLTALAFWNGGNKEKAAFYLRKIQKPEALTKANQQFYEEAKQTLLKDKQ